MLENANEVGAALSLAANAQKKLYLTRCALEELLGAREVEFTGDQTDDEPDDEPVGQGKNEDGTPNYMCITFGMLRRCRRVLNEI